MNKSLTPSSQDEQNRFGACPVLVAIVRCRFIGSPTDKRDDAEEMMGRRDGRAGRLSKAEVIPYCDSQDRHIQNCWREDC